MAWRTSITLRKTLIASAGIAVGVGALWLALRDFSYESAREIVAEADVLLLCLSTLAYLASVSLRGLRWHALMRAAVDHPFASATVLVVGYAVNNVLPARLGELFRIEYSHRRLGPSRGYCGGLLVTERIFDLACIACVLGIAASMIVRPGLASQEGYLHTIIWSFLLLLLSAIAVAGMLVIFSRRASVGSDAVARGRVGWRKHWDAKVLWLCRELHQAGTALARLTRLDFASIGMISVAIWFLEGLTLWLVARSLGLDLGLEAVALLLFVSSLSTLLPSAPGYLGTYQLAFVVALSFVGIGASAAVTAATVQQVINIGLATMIGLILLMAGQPRKALITPTG